MATQKFDAMLPLRSRKAVTASAMFLVEVTTSETFQVAATSMAQHQAAMTSEVAVTAGSLLLPRPLLLQDGKRANCL